MNTYQDIQQYIVNTYVNRKLNIIKGKGVFLFEDNGQKYLDSMSNYGVNIFGYNHPILTKDLANQIKKIITLHGSFNNDIRAQASEKLVKMCGEKYYQVYWSNSGAEAIESALKFAVLQSKKRRFIVCEHGYHGKTLGALSATAGEKYKKPFEPLLWEFVSIPFNDIKALKSAIDKDTAGFIVEPIQGEGGIYIPDSDYLPKVRDVCTENGVLLIIDEIQTGMGRTGKFLASENIPADILCLGKGLGGGIPIGATLINKKVSISIDKGIHTSTFGGNPLACIGALSTLKLLNKTRLNYIKNTGEYFLKQLLTLDSKYILDVRGKGLMLGLEVVKDKRNEILKSLQNEHILVIPAGENVVRFLPPFILEKKHINVLIKKLQKILISI